jgi:hypothetical protein
MRKSILILTLIFFVTSAMDKGRVAMYQASDYDTNAKMKAVFIYNFTKLIEWPESYKQGNFVIGLLGPASVTDELVSMATTKKAVNQTIEIKKFNSASEITNCHILYVSKSKSSELSQIISKTKGKSTLIVTEENGYAKQGAGISFVVVDNKQKFELNKSIIQERNMMVGSNLMSLATEVY